MCILINCSVLACLEVCMWKFHEVPRIRSCQAWDKVLKIYKISNLSLPCCGFGQLKAISMSINMMIRNCTTNMRKLALLALMQLYNCNVQTPANLRLMCSRMRNSRSFFCALGFLCTVCEYSSYYLQNRTEMLKICRYLHTVIFAMLFGLLELQLIVVALLFRLFLIANRRFHRD